MPLSILRWLASSFWTNVIRMKTTSDFQVKGRCWSRECTNKQETCIRLFMSRWLGVWVQTFSTYPLMSSLKLGASLISRDHVSRWSPLSACEEVVVFFTRLDDVILVVSLHAMLNGSANRSELVDDPIIDGTCRRLSLSSLTRINVVIEMKSLSWTNLRGSIQHSEVCGVCE